MTLNDILAMCNAGFTAKQIASFVDLENQTSQHTQPVQPAQPVQPVQPAQPVQPVQPAQPVQTVQQMQPVQQTTAQDTQQQFNEILRAIQNNNVINAQQPAVKTSEQILAEIINPPAKEV